jgi:uncharacterized protein YndB with AHSA1/START domain
MIVPDLSDRPFRVSAERTMPVKPEALYLAWTERFDLWFAAPGTLLMRGEVDAPYFFETHFEGRRYPHYGRFLRLDPNRTIEMTWVTSATLGAETVVRVELEREGGATRVRLAHEGLPDETLRKRHEEAWPRVLEHLEHKLKDEL